jgi:hypothetical protein
MLISQGLEVIVDKTRSQLGGARNLVGEEDKFQFKWKSHQIAVQSRFGETIGWSDD